ncbi:uncharacterized protein BKCO1_5600050 [Diplodia corticola]|uniref:Cell wall protein n=1 Tax=Diplodia corticola TaxID=236234 RepID=A0A1J9RSC3_9PEZI|nr:uncharacterized protein BKCO1_5600050 [Diplodia corticola]OJD30780.1 hypothetical protein BKCO1_5600050 [Diplodia corticola]
MHLTTLTAALILSATTATHAATISYPPDPSTTPTPSPSDYQTVFALLADAPSTPSIHLAALAATNGSLHIHPSPPQNATCAWPDADNNSPAFATFLHDAATSTLHLYNGSGSASSSSSSQQLLYTDRSPVVGQGLLRYTLPTADDDDGYGPDAEALPSAAESAPWQLQLRNNSDDSDHDDDHDVDGSKASGGALGEYLAFDGDAGFLACPEGDGDGDGEGQYAGWEGAWKVWLDVGVEGGRGPWGSEGCVAFRARAVRTERVGGRGPVGCVYP